MAGINSLKMVTRQSITQGVEPLLETAVGWIDRLAFAADRGRVGRVSAVLVDDERRPQWIVVRSGRFRRSSLRVAFADCEIDGHGVWIGDGGLEGAVHERRVRGPQRTAGARRRSDCA